MPERMIVPGRAGICALANGKTPAEADNGGNTASQSHSSIEAEIHVRPQSGPPQPRRKMPRMPTMMR